MCVRARVRACMLLRALKEKALILPEGPFDDPGRSSSAWQLGLILHGWNPRCPAGSGWDASCSLCGSTGHVGKPLSLYYKWAHKSQCLPAPSLTMRVEKGSWGYKVTSVGRQEPSAAEPTLTLLAPAVLLSRAMEEHWQQVKTPEF